MEMASYISLAAFSDRGFTTHSNGIGSLRANDLSTTSLFRFWRCELTVGDSWCN